jgi:DNA-binding CsgD family transcriptional regulator/tetratricopeptide (TPR) repeat protein
MTAPLPGSPPALPVGRERELALLRDHLSAALDGRGSVVLIGGEAGIGKTAVAETISREASEQGALVLVGRSFDLAEDPPYGPWVDLFSHYRPGADLPPPPAAFAERGTVGAVASQAALFHAVLDFLAALAAQRPLVVLLEDAHWQDAASLDLLRFLAREVAALPILLLVTYRVDEITRRHPLYPLLPILVREASATRITLHPLEDDDTTALVRGRFHLSDANAARLVTYLDQRGEGNPFFIGELLETLTEQQVLRESDGGWVLGDLSGVRVPLLLQQVVVGRLARLSDNALHLLEWAAVIGQVVPIPVWLTVTQVSRTALLDAVERAVEMRLLDSAPDGASVRFVHALIREAIYAGIMPMRRQEYHRAVGEALAALPDPDPDAVAHHFQQAGDARAVEWLLRAGGRAQAAYAWVTAAARFEAALAMIGRTSVEQRERGWLVLRISRLLRYADVGKARACAGEALALAQSTEDRALGAYARYQRGILGIFARDLVGGLVDLEAGAEALASLSAAEREEFAAHAVAVGAPAAVPDGRGTVVSWRASAGRFQEARALGESLLASVESDDGAEQGLRDAYPGLARTYAELGMPDAAKAMFERTHDAYLRGGDYANAAVALWGTVALLMLPYRTEDIAGRHRLMDRLVEEWARASGVVPTTIPARYMRVPIMLLEGEWDEADQLATVVAAETQGNLNMQARALTQLAMLAQLRGETERAWQMIRHGLPEGSTTEPGTVLFDVGVRLQQVAVALSLDVANLTAAREWLTAHDRWLAWSGAVNGQAAGHTLWAQYHRQIGDIHQARQHAEEALAHASEPRQPLALLAAHRRLGELATEAGGFADASHHLDASLALADACAAPYERALTVLALAELRMTEGDAGGARTLLAAARATFVALGARPALARADVLAARLDAAPGTPPTYPAGLSAREVEVLRLVADGLSNADIADRLFLSKRTVQVHVARILQKTGAENRAGAAAFALRHGLA